MAEVFRLTGAPVVAVFVGNKGYPQRWYLQQGGSDLLRSVGAASFWHYQVISNSGSHHLRHPGENCKMVLKGNGPSWPLAGLATTSALSPSAAPPALVVGPGPETPQADPVSGSILESPPSPPGSVLQSVAVAL